MFHISDKKQRKEYLKKTSEDALISKTIYETDAISLTDHVLNRQKRYAPKNTNYYDIRRFTYENRKNHKIAGAVHPDTSGYVIWTTFSFAVPYNTSRKWAKFLGANMTHIPTVINVPTILGGIPWMAKQDNTASYKWMYENGYTISIYGADYDSCMTFEMIYRIFKTFMKEEEYKKFMEVKWEQGDNSVTKTFGKIRFGMFYNANHLLGRCRHKSIPKFVQETIDSTN